MTLKDIAFFSLKRRKARAAFILAGLTIGVASLVGLVSLSQSLTKEVNHQLEKYGANILILPRTENLVLNYEGLDLGGVSFELEEIRQADLAALATIKNAANIAAVGPVVLGVIPVGQKKALLAGIDFQAAQILKPWWQMEGHGAGHDSGQKGKKRPGPDQVLIGAEAARILKLGPGDSFQAGGRRLEVSAVLDQTGSQDDQLIFAHLATAQAVLGKDGLVSLVEVAALCNACPVEEMVRQMAQVLPQTKVMAVQQVVRSRLEAIGHFKKFSLAVSATIMLVGGLVVLVTMLGNVRERTAEIGVLRAIGFRQADVAKVILLEAAVVAWLAGLGGVGLGLAASRVIILFLAGHSSGLALDPSLIGGALALATAVGLGASVYPALQASRLDPNQALRAF